MKKWIVAGMALLALPLMATVAFAESWNGYHWSSDKQSPTVVNTTRSSLYDVPAAVQEWADLGTPIQPALVRGKKADIFVMENSTISSLGHTDVLWNDSGHIIQATVYLNTALLELYGPAAADQVLCHELGHALGLAHNDIDTDSCTNTTIWPGTATAASASDAEQLNLIYGHLDGGTSDGGTTKKGGGGSGGDGGGKGGGKPSK